MSENMTAVYFSISVLGMWWLYFVEYRSYLLAKARQDLFAARDTLFEAAARGDLPFDSAAYVMTRAMLNGSIRFMHRVSLIRIVGMIYANTMVRGPKARSKFSRDYAAARQELSAAGRQAIDAAHLRMHVVLIRYIVTRSLFLSMVNLFAMLLAGLRQAVRKRILVDKKWAVIDNEIKEVGQGRACVDDVVHA